MSALPDPFAAAYFAAAMFLGLCGVAIVAAVAWHLWAWRR